MGEIQLPSSSESRKNQFAPQKHIGKMPLPSAPMEGRDQVSSQEHTGKTLSFSSLGIRRQISPQPDASETPPFSSLSVGRSQAPPQQDAGETPPFSSLSVGRSQAPPQALVNKMPVPAAPRTGRDAIALQKPVDMPLPAAPRVRRRDQAVPQKRARLMYFASAFLVIIIITFAGFHSAGISLSTLFATHMSTASVVSYSLPNVNPLFADTFVNDASGWNQQSSPNNYTVAVGNGTLTLEVKQNKLLWEPMPGTLSYSDFVLSVNAVLAKGDKNSGYGVYIRGTANQQSDLASYYRFELYGDASYAIFKGVTDQNGNFTSIKIVDYTLNPAILKQGQPNHLMISAQGTTMSFIVNGQFIKTFSDASYMNGSIALFASNLGQTKPDAQVQFSQLSLYPVQVSKGE